MKKITKAMLVAISYFLVGCNVTTPTGGNSNGANNNGGGDKQPSGNAYATEYKTDWIDLVEGASAYDDWYAEKYFYDVKFDKDGKCLAYTTTYQLQAGADQSLSNQRLEGGNFAPVWNSEKTQFTTSRKSVTYVKATDITESWDNDYLPYTIYYSDNTSKKVDEPTQAKKDEDFRNNLGFSKESLVLAGTSNPEYHNQKKTAIGVYLTCDTIDTAKVNEYGLALYNTIKAAADGGVLYDYIEYTPIEACPQISNTYESLYFMYMYNNVKINVAVSTYNNYDTGVTKLSVTIAKSSWN